MGKILQDLSKAIDVMGFSTKNIHKTHCIVPAATVDAVGLGLPLVSPVGGR